MPTLALRSFGQTVQDSAAAAQAASTVPLDFTVGGVLRALVEADASDVLWLQYVALQVLAATRLATSQGADVDSFVDDYSLDRLPASAATGAVTLSRFSTGSAALVVPGGQVKTLDGTQTFTITTDATNAAWSVSQGGYVIASGVASVIVPVQAVSLGTQGNVVAGAIGLLASAIPYVDSVTNALAFTNGLDAESDAALRLRFQLYIAGLSKATETAIGSAVLGVRQGLTYVITEGAPGVGSVTITVDDGTGSPSSALLALVATAVNAVRAAGISYAVQGPTVTAVSINVTLTLASGAVRAPLVAAASLAISAYVGALGVGQVLPFVYLAAVVFNTSPLITNAAITVNGDDADINPGSTGVVRASSVTVA